MVSRERARSLALRQPEAIEQDHHGRPSFRIAPKIFATLWDEVHMNVMLGNDGILTAVQRNPEACTEFWWGTRLRAVSVNLDRAHANVVVDLLADAWESKAQATNEPTRGRRRSHTLRAATTLDCFRIRTSGRALRRPTAASPYRRSGTNHVPAISAHPDASELTMSAARSLSTRARGFGLRPVASTDCNEFEPPSAPVRSGAFRSGRARRSS